MNDIELLTRQTEDLERLLGVAPVVKLRPVDDPLELLADLSRRTAVMERELDRRAGLRLVAT